MVSAEMQNIFGQNVRVNRLFHARLDAPDAAQLLRLDGPVAEILSSCDKLASLRVDKGAALYQHTLEFRRYLAARFGYAGSMGLMAPVLQDENLNVRMLLNELKTLSVAARVT
jgi:hypothetical protein